MDIKEQIPLLDDMLKSISGLGSDSEDVVLRYRLREGTSLHDVVKGNIIGLLSEDTLSAAQVSLLAMLLSSPAASLKDL
jgi:hypothetical protein